MPKNGIVELEENVLNDGKPIDMVPVQTKAKATVKSKTTRKKPTVPSKIVQEIVNNFTPEVGCYVVGDETKVKLPEYATQNAACFDLFTYLNIDEPVTVYTASNFKKKRNPLLLRQDDGMMVLSLVLNPGERALIPTGLIFAIPNGWSIRLHPRSGLALKNFIGLANSEGVIDDDYVNQTYALLANESDKQFVISIGDRLCQGEIYKNQPCTMKRIYTQPTQKTDRTGGLGSTGVK